MPLVIEDRVRETTIVTGTNDATLLGAVTGFQAFSVIGNGNTTYYTISDQSGNNWEVGLGTYSTSGPTLARTTVLSSSAGGSKVSFPAGTKDVFVTYPSEKAVYLDGSNNVQPALGNVVASQVNITGQGDLRLEDTTGGEYVALQAPGTLASSYTLTMPADDGTNGQALITDGSGNLSWSTAASGDVYGPASATDNAISRFDGTTGKIIQNSLVTISDTGAISAPVDASISGLTVGKGGGAVSNNTAVGFNALAGSNSGVGFNTAVGFQSLNANTTGQQNTAVGVNSMLLNTTGSLNAAFSTQALNSNTTGSNNAAFGYQALFSNTTASNNTAVGYQAGFSNTTGTLTALGYLAGNTNTTGTNLIAIGNAGGNRNTTGNDNIFIGANSTAASAGVTGSNNIGVGSLTFYSNTSGANNVAIGFQSMLSNTTASNNTAVGYQAAFLNATGTAITAVGYQAAYSSTSGIVTAIGLSALATNTTGRNSALGYLALTANTTGTQNTGLGDTALFSNTTGSSNTAVGMSALLSNTTASNNTAVGYQAHYLQTTGGANTSLGVQAGYGDATGASNTWVGYQAGPNTVSNASGSNNVAVGRNALFSNTTASNNTAVGYQAGYSNTTGLANTALGNTALRSNTTANNNVAIGYQAAYYNTTGASNVAIGVDALVNNTTASNNTAVGFQAAYINTTGAKNTYLGAFAGYTSNAAGDAFNVFVGYATGYGVTTGTGNSFMGQNAGSAVTTGSKNTIVGRYDGNQGGLDLRTASNHIVLSDGDGNPRGYWNNAGIFKVYNNVTANNVAEIVQQNTATGLSFGLKVAGGTNASDYCLGGDNALGTIALFRFYGDGNMAISNSTATKSSGTTWANPSDIRLKDNIQDYTKGLETLSKINVKTWEYNGKANTTVGTKGLGVIADEIMQILPDTVDTYASKLNPNDETITDVKRFDATEITWLLVNAVKELKAEVDSLKQQLNGA